MMISIEINKHQAWSLVDAIRRSGFSDWRKLAVSDDEAYAAQYAAEQVRRAIEEAENDAADRQ